MKLCVFLDTTDHLIFSLLHLAAFYMVLVFSSQGYMMTTMTNDDFFFLFASIPLTKAAQIKIKARLLGQRDVDEISQKTGARFVLDLEQVFYFFNIHGDGVDSV